MPRKKPADKPASVTFADGTSAPVKPNGTIASPVKAESAEAKTRVGFYMLGSDANRARATYVYTGPYSGIRSFSDYIAAAVNEKRARDEAQYNDGRPFPAVKAGDLPTGRPVEV